MANQALSIMKLRTLIRFKEEGRTHKFIGRTLGLSRTTVIKYIQFLEGSGLDWAALSSLDDQGLLTLCRSGHTDQADDRWTALSHLLPHYEQELKRPHVTRQTLLEEYRQAYPEEFTAMSFLLRRASEVIWGCEARETRSLLPENGFVFFKPCQGDKPKA